MPRQPFVPLHLCNDSHLCRCIVQRLCVAVFMHPCITALCDRHRASLLKTLGVHFIRHPCPFLVKGEVLSPTKIRATTGGDATPSALAPHSPSKTALSHTTHRRTWLPCQRELDCDKATSYHKLSCPAIQVYLISSLALSVARLRDRHINPRPYQPSQK